VNKCRVEFIYDAMGKPFPIGLTFDPRTLALVKRQILREADEEYEVIKDADPVLRIEHWDNLKRLRDTLDMLIPPDTDWY